MCADESGCRFCAYRRQSKPTHEGEINPIGQSGFQLNEGFPFCFAGDDQTAKTRNASSKSFVLAEEDYLRRV